MVICNFYGCSQPFLLHERNILPGIADGIRRRYDAPYDNVGQDEQQCYAYRSLDDISAGRC